MSDDAFVVIFVFLIVGIVVYFKKIKPWRKKREKEARYAIEREQSRIAKENEIERLKENLRDSKLLRNCSEIIEAYHQFLQHNDFDISGGIVVVTVPEPRGSAAAMSVELVLETYCDDWKMRDLFNGKLSLIYTGDEERIEYWRDTGYNQCIALGSNDMAKFLIANGVPEQLFDHYLSVKPLGEDKVRWTTKAYEISDIYGNCERVSHFERVDILGEILNEKYPENSRPKLGLVVRGGKSSL